MRYVYKGLDATGTSVYGTIEGTSLEDASRQLRTQGIVFSSLKSDSGSILEMIQLAGSKNIPPSLLAGISRDLSVYLRSGVPLMRALSLQERQYKGKPVVYRFLHTLVSLIDEGKSLSVAMETQKHFVIPRFYIGTLRASEDRGVLAEVLTELSSYLQVGEQIRSQLTKAFIYPGFIVGVSVLTVSFMLTTIVPKLSTIFETTGQELPALTQWILSMSHFLSAWWMVLATVGIVGVSMFVAAYKTNQEFCYRVDAMILSMPILGKIVQTSDLARFSAISSLLIRSGIPIVKAIALSSATLSSSVLRSQFIYGAERIVEGGKLSASLASSEHVVLDEAFVSALAVGEETSELPIMLESLSTLYMERNRESIALFLTVLEPLLILIVGGVIGVIVMAMLLPIFSLSLG
ncbi:MAG: hypothetical protein B7Y17_01570 [Sulfuricurvum sp. 24-42-5]|nr:MAG: hypothetical protein B7Y17_01570 [Sulfuricurvum sp. 24-42-5]